MKTVPFLIVMMQLMPKYPFDDLDQDDLDRVMNGNSATLVSGVGSGCANSSWSWSDNLMGVASCGDQEEVMTLNDLMNYVPSRLKVALSPLRDFDDCWDWSECGCDGSTRQTG